MVQAGDLPAAVDRRRGGVGPERQAVQVGGQAVEIDLVAVRFGMAPRGVESAPQAPGPPHRIAGQGGIQASDGDGAGFECPGDRARDEQFNHFCSSLTG